MGSWEWSFEGFIVTVISGLCQMDMLFISQLFSR